MANKAQQADAFPALGHEYRADYAGDNTFVIALKSDTEMTSLG